MYSGHNALCGEGRDLMAYLMKSN
jgi:hypothetical protein